MRQMYPSRRHFVSRNNPVTPPLHHTMTSCAHLIVTINPPWMYTKKNSLLETDFVHGRLMK